MHKKIICLIAIRFEWRESLSVLAVSARVKNLVLPKKIILSYIKVKSKIHPLMDIMMGGSITR